MLGKRPYTLATQMIISFVILVILTAVTVGLPAVWLIQGQLDRQARSQVYQGQRAALALYAAKQTETDRLATLIAQRPKLREYVESQEVIALTDYLTTLRVGSGLDVIFICDESGQLVDSTLESIPTDVCETWIAGGYQVVLDVNLPQIWITASAQINDQASGLGWVIVAEKFDDEFAREMEDETGLGHSLWLDNQLVASSLIPSKEQIIMVSRTTDDSVNDDINYDFAHYGGQPFIVSRFPITEGAISAEVALSTADIRITRYRIILYMITSIVVVAFGGSIAGVLLSRHISQPLEHLSDSAENFREGVLDTPVNIESRVQEVIQVSHALENARLDLSRTLTSLQHEKDWVEHLLESIVEGIVTLDGDGRITFFSHGAEQITGWNRDEILLKHFDEVFYLQKGQTQLSQTLPEPGSRVKLPVKLADARIATLSVTGARLAPTEAENAQLVFVFRDVSDEETIHRLLGHFLANVSHEFRTPLSSLAASIELLLDQAIDLDPGELHQLLISLHLGTLGLQTLVDNLLESASIEAGHFRVSPKRTDLGRIIAEAVRMMQPLIEKYDQRLVVEISTPFPIVFADERRTVQVLVNLLSNASKFGSPGDQISISTRLDQNWVKISVADRGLGVSEDQLNGLFFRFNYSGSQHESAKAGAGLGLSVVKAVIEAHGGQVGAENRSGGGMIFWFTLPESNEQ